MAQGVVDRLEAVEVDQQESAGLTGAVQAGERVGEALAQVQAIGQAGERIDAGHLRGAGLGTPTRAHVLQGHGPPCLGHRLHLDLQNAIVQS